MIGITAVALQPAPKRLLRDRALIVASIVAAIIGIAMLLVRHVVIIENPLDFRAFYCAGSAALHGADPYRAEPLRSCEAAAIRAVGLNPIADLALPAPLPGYVLAILMLAARVDFITASSLFAMMSIIAVGVTAVILRRLTELPLISIIAALSIADAYLGIVTGQIVPVFIMLLSAAALACRLKRPALAALCCAGATMEPHLALPACISLALFVPRSRGPLAALALIFSAISVVALGPAENLEYLVKVLPAHVASEATSVGQFSLVSVLFHFGVPLEWAIRDGEWSYALMIATGLIVTRLLLREGGARETVVLVPTAFALLGGSFIHLAQMSAAIPVALLLIARSPLSRPILVAALSFVAIPWLTLVDMMAIKPIALMAVVVFVIATLVLPLLRRGMAAFALSVALICYAGLLSHMWAHENVRAADVAPALTRVAGAQELAEKSWTVYERLTQGRETLRIDIAKIPTWIGLVVILAFTLPRNGAARRSIDPSPA